MPDETVVNVLRQLAMPSSGVQVVEGVAAVAEAQAHLWHDP